MTTALSEEKSPLVSTAPTAGVAALQAINARGWEEFQQLPFPVRTDEAWRFTNLKSINLDPYTQARPASEEATRDLVARSTGLAATAGRMIFANDTLVCQEILHDTLRQQGVIWKPLEQAAAEHPELFEKHFMAHGAELGGRKFAALHQASIRTGTFLYVPKGVKVELPIEVFHWLEGENNSTFPHTLIILDEGAKVTLIDYFHSAREEAGLAIGVNDLHVADRAELTYVCMQDWSRKALAFQINNTIVGANATAKSLNLNLGCSYARTESLSKLIGEGARSDMLAVTVGGQDQEYDQRTLQDHFSPGAHSDLLYKNALDANSRVTFAGLIKVEDGAHRTDAYQKVRNLMLSDEAEANAAPGLEILADDVRCTHGATSGQIETEELFYMLARGIHLRTAQRLIVNGFLREAVDRLDNTEIAAALGEKIAAEFAL